MNICKRNEKVRDSRLSLLSRTIYLYCFKALLIAHGRLFIAITAYLMPTLLQEQSEV